MRFNCHGFLVNLDLTFLQNVQIKGMENVKSSKTKKSQSVHATSQSDMQADNAGTSKGSQQPRICDILSLNKQSAIDSLSKHGVMYAARSTMPPEPTMATNAGSSFSELLSAKFPLEHEAINCDSETNLPGSVSESTTTTTK